MNNLVFWLFYAAIILSAMPIRDNVFGEQRTVRWRYFRLLPYMMMFLFMAFRYEYGDTTSYRKTFFDLKAGISVSVEQAYILLNKILSSFQLVVILTAALYIYSLYYLLSREVPVNQRLFALLIILLHPHIFGTTMSAMRQGIAISLFLIGVCFSKERGKWWLVPFCLLGGLFHKSALILCVVCFLLNREVFSRKLRVVFQIGSLLAYVLVEKMIDIILWVLRATSLDYPNYVYYLQNGNQNSLLSTLVAFVILVLLCALADETPKGKSIFVNLAIVGATMEVLQGSVQMIARIAMYFLPFYAVAFSVLLSNKYCRPRLRIFRVTIALNQSVCWLIKLVIVGVLTYKFNNFIKQPLYHYTSIFFR